VITLRTDGEPNHDGTDLAAADAIELSVLDARIITLLSMGLSAGRVAADLGIELSDIRRACANAGGAR
jgi:hypothetical protein